MVSSLLSYLTVGDLIVLAAAGGLVAALVFIVWFRFHSSFWWPLCIAAVLCGLYGIWVTAAAMIEIDREQAGFVFAFGLSSLAAAIPFVGSFLIASSVVWGPSFFALVAIVWWTRSRYLEGKG